MLIKHISLGINFFIMAIPARPIGQDPVSQQLWNISKQMEQLIGQVGAVVKNTAGLTTTTTTTTATP
jgi:hypothetical protein|tara:strand:- start:1473 stop:1673 length:201 start_codon:yes stop_codon:yes gene_type:complete